MPLQELKLILFRLYTTYVKSHIKKILIALILSIIVAGTTAAIAWLLDPAVKKIFIEQDRTLAWFIPLLIIVTFASKGLSLYFARIIVIRIGEEIAGKIKKEDACIDWNKSYQDLHNQVRAYSGWPVSHTKLQDSVIRIWQTEKVANRQGMPGEILEVDKDTLVVACGSGALAIIKIQLPNSKPMLIKDCLNSKRAMFIVGEFFS